MNLSQSFKIKLGLFLIVTLTFIVGFTLNITSDQSIYNQNLNIVPSWQNSKSKAFIIFMNIISNIFNPVICAGYVALFWLISSKKMQILVFLIWFIFVSWLLTILKLIIHQPRPYWIQNSGIQMLQWTCYSEFGCPSGHSMLGLILMEFIVRFIVRSFKNAKKFIWILYIIMLILQLLVMFSRVILGMHTFNEVLMGAMIGIYLISIYYIYVQSLILKYIFALLTTKRKGVQTIILIFSMLCFFTLELLLQFLIDFNNTAYFNVIQATQGCGKVKYYKSFQYKCLEDSALIMANFGILISILYMQHPQNFTKPMQYSKISCKYFLKVLIMIIAAAIAVAVFLNPLWTKIDSDTVGLALIIWSTQNLGFFFAIIMMIFVGIPLNGKIGLQQYGKSQYIYMLRGQNDDNRQKSQPQIQLTIQNFNKQ